MYFTLTFYKITHKVISKLLTQVLIKRFEKLPRNNLSSLAVNLTSRPRCSQRASSSLWPAHPSHDIASSSQPSRSLSSKQVDRGMLDPRGVLGSSGFQRCIWPTHKVRDCDHLLTNIYKVNFLKIVRLSRTFCLIFLCACFMSIPALLETNTHRNWD